MNIQNDHQYKNYIKFHLTKLRNQAQYRLEEILEADLPEGATACLLEAQPTRLWSKSQVIIRYINNLPNWNEVSDRADFFISESLDILPAFSEAEEDNLDELGLDTVTLEMEAVIEWLYGLFHPMKSNYPDRIIWGGMHDEKRILNFSSGNWEQ